MLWAVEQISTKTKVHCLCEIVTQMHVHIELHVLIDHTQDYKVFRRQK